MDASVAVPPVLLMLALLLANAFFVAAEFAFVRVRQTQLDELAQAGSARARLAARIGRDLESYVSVAQLGVTLASLLLGFVGEPAVGRLIEPAFGWLAERSDAAFHVVSFTLTFAVITYVTVVLGELAPKYLAIQRALAIALWCAYPLDLFRRLTYPYTTLVNRSARWVIGLVGGKPSSELDAHSEEELRMLIAASTRKGILQESERVIVGNALDFADTLVRQVMVPRTEMIAVADDLSRDGIVALARQHPFSRFPVYHRDLDDIVGVVHLRDLATRGEDGLLARDVMRRVPAIPETLPLDRALAEFRKQRASLIIVLDEFGGTAGLVTLEDIVEEVVGEVRDEFERDVLPGIRPDGPGALLVDGLTALDEVRERIGLVLEDEQSDSVGGMVFGRLGRPPAVGDAIEVEGWRFAVTQIDGRRVAQVRAERSPAA
ncbi:MAG: hemolysin family protein [Candidatus Limnocylindria bacterium]|nr:hemolysin family protein [Candidatus Limnocylindria bacterium]